MLSINQQKCIQCGTCINDCHRKALSIVEEEVKFDSTKCMWCGHCMAVCPRDCIIIDGDGYDCEEVEDMGFAQIPNKVAMRNMILRRRSVRHFTDDDVTEEEVNNILEAGKYSPTGMNRQGNAFVVVTKEKMAELQADTIEAFKRLLAAGSIPEERAAAFQKLCDEYDETGVDNNYYGAPMVIFVFADSDVDGAICAANMGNMAFSQQLGFCFARIPVIAYEDAEFASKWGAFEGKKVVISLIIGNPEPDYFSSVPRKNPPVIVF